MARKNSYTHPSHCKTNCSDSARHTASGAAAHETLYSFLRLLHFHFPCRNREPIIDCEAWLFGILKHLATPTTSLNSLPELRLRLQSGREEKNKACHVREGMECGGRGNAECPWRLDGKFAATSIATTSKKHGEFMVGTRVESLSCQRHDQCLVSLSTPMYSKKCLVSGCVGGYYTHEGERNEVTLN